MSSKKKTKYIEADFQQRTPEWYKGRQGKITGSIFHSIDKKGRTAGSVSVESLKQYGKLAIEQMNGWVVSPTDAMSWGTSLEPHARELFAKIISNKYPGTTVREANLCISNEYQHLAVSPDGIVDFPDGSQALLEIKCLQPQNFYEIAKTWRPIPEHMDQIDLMLFTLGIEKCYYFVFCPLVSDPIGCCHLIEYSWGESEKEEKINTIKTKLQRGLDGIESCKQALIQAQQESKRKLLEFADEKTLTDLIKQTKTDFIKTSEFGVYLTNRDDLEDVEGYPVITDYQSDYLARQAFKELQQELLDSEYDYLK